MPRSAAGSARCRSSTATISPRWRRIAGSRCGRCSSELAAELRAGAPEQARALAIDLELDTVYTTQDVAVAIAFLVTEIVEYRDAQRARRAGRDLAAPDQRADRAADARAARCWSRRRRRRPEQDAVRADRRGLAKQLRSPLERKLGRYSVDLPVFPADYERSREIVTAPAKKYFEELGTAREEAAFCSSDSDLLPPRSRYPLKWARNRQPSPPPVALPGPSFCLGPPQSQSSSRRRSRARRAPVGQPDREDREFVERVERHQQHQHRHHVGRGQHRRHRGRSRRSHSAATWPAARA